MATLSAQNPTLLDVAKRTDPNGNIDTIVELLNATNPILDDMVWLEGNLPTGHRSTVRTGLPTPTWRKLYGGVQPTKSTTAQVTDACGMLEAYAEVDKALADLNGNTAAFRLSEDRAHLEGMSQEFADTLFYGEASRPEEFIGLASRYNSLSAQNADNIVNHGDTTSNDLTSIWLIVWGQNTVHGIYPKGSKAGLQMTDKGQVTIENATGFPGGAVGGGRYEGYRTHYRWDCGLTVRDWRYAVRICNVDAGKLTTEGTAVNRADAQKALINSMIKATERIPNLGAGRPIFYMNRTLRESLRLGILEHVSSNMTFESVAGKRVMVFDEMPVHRTDALKNSESLVS